MLCSNCPAPLPLTVGSLGRSWSSRASWFRLQTLRGTIVCSCIGFYQNSYYFFWSTQLPSSSTLSTTITVVIPIAHFSRLHVSLLDLLSPGRQRKAPVPDGTTPPWHIHRRPWFLADFNYTLPLVRVSLASRHFPFHQLLTVEKAQDHTRKSDRPFNLIQHRPRSALGRSPRASIYPLRITLQCTVDLPSYPLTPCAGDTGSAPLDCAFKTPAWLFTRV